MITVNNTNNILNALYPNIDLLSRAARLESAVKRFCSLFPQKPFFAASSPARAEIIGNHTDHQNGRVLAAAVNIDILCVASHTDDGSVNLHSENFAPVSFKLGAKIDKPAHAGLAAGCAEYLSRFGVLRGFNAYMRSDIPIGFGLSSSAAFEAAVCAIFARTSNLKLSPLQTARAGQYAERKYLKKPCGLMDQLTVSAGGLLYMDFKNGAYYKKMPSDALKRALRIYIINAGASHENLSCEYGRITTDMKSVAGYFKKSVLADVSEKEFYRRLPEIAKETGERAVLRAAHFFDETRRVKIAAADIKNRRFDEFLSLIRQSGVSSCMLLQNVFMAQKSQQLHLAYTLSRRALKNTGGARVHGGGFAGGVIALMPACRSASYAKKMRGQFGKDAVIELSIREEGTRVFKIGI